MVSNDIYKNCCNFGIETGIHVIQILFVSYSQSFHLIPNMKIFLNISFYNEKVICDPL